MFRLVAAPLEQAYLLEVDLKGAYLTNAKLQGAYLADANLGGADLRYARNLTQEQLDAAIGDDQTKLPDGLTRPAHWSKAEAPEGQPAAQPDDSERAPAEDGAPGSDK